MDQAHIMLAAVLVCMVLMECNRVISAQVTVNDWVLLGQWVESDTM